MNERIEGMGSEELPHTQELEPLKLTRPEHRQRVTVADVIGPEATRLAIEEEREFQQGTRVIGPHVRRRAGVH